MTQLEEQINSEKGSGKREIGVKTKLLFPFNSSPPMAEFTFWQATYSTAVANRTAKHRPKQIQLYAYGMELFVERPWAYQDRVAALVLMLLIRSRTIDPEPEEEIGLINMPAAVIDRIIYFSGLFGTERDAQYEAICL